MLCFCSHFGPTLTRTRKGRMLYMTSTTFPTRADELTHLFQYLFKFQIDDLAPPLRGYIYQDNSDVVILVVARWLVDAAEFNLGDFISQYRKFIELPLSWRRQPHFLGLPSAYSSWDGNLSQVLSSVPNVPPALDGKDFEEPFYATYRVVGL